MSTLHFQRWGRWWVWWESPDGWSFVGFFGFVIIVVWNKVISNICYVNGIFADIWLIFMVNVGKYTIRGWYGICSFVIMGKLCLCLSHWFWNQISRETQLPLIDLHRGMGPLWWHSFRCHFVARYRLRVYQLQRSFWETQALWGKSRNCRRGLGKDRFKWVHRVNIYPDFLWLTTCMWIVWTVFWKCWCTCFKGFTLSYFNQTRILNS